MMSELVEGSAWMKPPVDGPADGVIGAAAAPVALPVPAVPGGFVPASDVGVVELPDDAAPCGATSSLATSARRLAIRAGLGLRTMSELLRPSTMTCGAASVEAP